MHPALFDGQAGLDSNPVIAPLLFQHATHRMRLDIAGTLPRLIEPPRADWRPGFATFVKLGAKSWRDGGTLRTIAEHDAFPQRIAAMLGQLTSRQRAYLSLVRPLTDQLDLILFRYRDFTHISEARWHVDGGRARCSSRCLRGESASVAGAAEDAMHNLAIKAGTALKDDVIVDIAVEPNGTVTILEINPPRSRYPLNPPSP